MADQSARAQEPRLTIALGATTTDSSQRLAALASALHEGAPLWRPRPFAEDPPPWAGAFPEVAAWCEGLAPAELDALEAADRLPQGAPPQLRAWRERLDALTALPPLAADDRPTRFTLSTEAARLVPSRKRAQIEAFLGALALGPKRPLRVLDWCGGKGHLGRALGAREHLPVTVLEREATYRDEALRLASRDGVTLDFVVGDALEDRHDLFDDTLLAVGLHACGELGTRLLAHAIADGAHTVALAPCCLHKIPGLVQHGYHPLSAAGRGCDPRLDHGSLRLATADEVVARPGLRRDRRRENAFRLGVDLLLREAGQPTYTPLGTLPHDLVRADFATFARGAAAHTGLPLPTRWDPARAEAAGWRRAHRARAFGLVRSLFRRAIEVWCALDRVAWLEEHGLTVTIGRFAPRAVTPRDIMILASRVAPRRDTAPHDLMNP